MMNQPGGRVFTLEFHLPYFVWRNEAQKDRRKRADGSPLRSTKDLSFLTKPNQGRSYHQSGQSFLHEAQSSCVVTGYNNSIWTACSLTDTFYHSRHNSDDNEDMLPYYANDTDDTDDSEESWDPLTIGQCDANNPIWDPREYFLRILNVRLEQAKEEWLNIAYNLQEKLESYVSAPDLRYISSFYDWQPYVYTEAFS
jgi:hypothetical protein